MLLYVGLYWIRMLWQIEDSLSNCVSTYQPCSINNRSTNYLKSFYINSIYMYSPFHKTSPRPSAFENWISVRFYKTDCIHFFSLHLFTLLTLFTMKGPSNIKLWRTFTLNMKQRHLYLSLILYFFGYFLPSLNKF